MADEQHLSLLREGVQTWNQWRMDHQGIAPNLKGANLCGVDLRGVNLCQADLSQANLRDTYLNDADLYEAHLEGADLAEAHLSEANLSWANLSDANLSEASLWSADLSWANLSSAYFWAASLNWAILRGADLRTANLTMADLSEADLSEADLRGASLIRTNLVETNLKGANISSCMVYGVSVWNTQLAGTIQTDLRITLLSEPELTVDNLEVAQFLYLMLNNEKVAGIINTITSKVVLILGRFTPERKFALDTLREKLRTRGYVPVLFDFNVPNSRDMTETVTLLARMARFIVADVTEPMSIQHELQAIVPGLAVPVQPLLLKGASTYSMFVDNRKYDWVLPVHKYATVEDLVNSLEEMVIRPAEAKAVELERRRILPQP